MSKMNSIYIKIQNGELLTTREAEVVVESGYTVTKVINAVNGKSTIVRRVAEKLGLDYVDLASKEFTEDLYIVEFPQTL